MISHVVRCLKVGSTLALLGLVVGCGQTAPPQFELDMLQIAQKGITPEQQQELANILDAMFGTPDEPYVLPDSGLDLAKLQMAAGPVASDQFGRETGLYRRHCAHCHGTTGDGLGPTALLLNPYPRDYRQGKFKFKSTERAAKPTDYDLELILRHGVPGTAMPSFDLLPDTQVDSLIEYVKYLSLRGQVESRITDAFTELSEGDQLPLTRAALVEEIVLPLAEGWKTAPEAIIATDGDHAKPEMPLEESVAKGRELFYGAKGNCAKCHGWSALGDGQTNDYDDWSKLVVDAQKNLQSDLDSLRSGELPAEERDVVSHRAAMLAAAIDTDALPPRNAIPRDLRQGIYRGGRRPLDLYRRIYAGINGVPMPGVGPSAPGAESAMTSDEIWHVVDYVLSLPYEPISSPPRQQRTAINRAAL